MEKKNQRSSGKRSAATTKWADNVTIAENPNQNGIELRFNAEPSHELQSKLRASGFRPSKTQNMWYGGNTEANKSFASEIESTLPTTEDGPDLFLSPSFEAIKTNIEQRAFSFILITLKDGEIKSYIVFEPSKPKAEVIATQFARQEFGENFIALAVKPKTQMREARVLFDEGKIIFPNGQKIPTRKESTIKGSLPVTETLETEADKENETERQALDKFFKWATRQEDEDLRPGKITKELFNKWFKGNYPELNTKNVESMWQSYHRILITLYRFEKRSTGKAVMQPYSGIYTKLMKVIPDLIKYIGEGKYHGKSVKDPKGGLMDLSYDYVDKDKNGNYIIALSHHYEQNGDLVPDPDMQIRIFPDQEVAEAMTFQDYRSYQEVYPVKDGKEYVNTRLKKDLNQFLSQWLSNIIQQRHKIDLSQVESEETEEAVESSDTSETKPAPVQSDFQRMYPPEEEREIVEQFLAQGFKRPFSAQDAFHQQLPVIDLAFRYVEAMEFFRDNIEEPNTKKILKLRKELKELKGKGTNEKRESVKEEIEKLEGEVNNAEKLIQDESLIFNDDLFQIIIDKAKEKGYNNRIREDIHSFRDYVTTNVLDNRVIENYHQQPVNEVVDELIDEYFNKEAKTPNTERPSAGTEKANVTDLKSGDTFVPNVLVPADTKEPFYSHLFDMYDMKEVIKNNFPHLLTINDINLGSASPIALFELMQFGHPSEYGIDVNRQELIKEFEKRGKSIFQAIGFPTDGIYPYVNLHLGYESIEPLNEMLFDNNKDGDEWWAIAEHARPIADAKKAVKLIDQMIEKEKREMKTYLNPKTGKPKLEYKQQARDIEHTIENFQDSKEVLQHYLDNPTEESAAQTEEESTDPLANESGVYTEKTAGDNFEEIEIPMPKGAQFTASVSIAQTSAGDFKIGIHADKKFGDHSGMASPASIEGQSYSTREEALKYALKQLELRLDVLIASKDSILGNEEKKNKQLNMALDALKAFAEENNIKLENNPAPATEKVALKEIQLVTFPNDKKHRSETRTVYSWKDADEYFRKKKWVDETVQLKVIWQDFEIFERRLEYSHAHLYPGKNPISEFVYQANLTISKMNPQRGSNMKEKDVKKAQKLIAGYSFTDEETGTESAGIIKGLENTYWTKEDNEYSINKVVINGMKFNQARLRETIGTKLEKLPIATLNEIVKELSLKFKERRPLSTYEKSLVTIGKTGDKRKATLIASYVDDMILDNDTDKSKNPVMTFLVELLFSGEQKLVDLPQDIEKSSVPKAKKQSQFDLNKEIESFIDKKDKDGSYYNEEEKNYIRQYTGSGGLLKEGASGRGALYEYYTPELVVKKMWDMAYHYGYDGGSILEPSVGTGNFLKYAPKGAIIYGFETNHYSARIAQILYPHAHIHEKAFESLFFAGNIHLKDKFNHPLCSLVIGNPPYGEFTGKYAGMGEKQHTGATEYDQYFMLRGLYLLKENGLLVFLIPSSFITNQSKFNKVKEKIAAKAELIDLYRLPARVFETTDIGTDIIVLRKK